MIWNHSRADFSHQYYILFIHQSCSGQLIGKAQYSHDHRYHWVGICSGLLALINQKAPKETLTTISSIPYNLFADYEIIIFAHTLGNSVKLMQISENTSIPTNWYHYALWLIILLIPTHSSSFLPTPLQHFSLEIADHQHDSNDQL